MLFDLIKIVLFVAVLVSGAAIVYDKKVKPVPFVEKALSFVLGLPKMIYGKLTNKSQ